MKRLTIDRDTQYDFVGKYDTNIEEFANNKELRIAVMNKLGQLEDIEEELSISLVVLFKALNQEEVYVKLSNGKIDKCAFIVEKITDNVWGFTYPIHEDFISYFLKDYGVTWSLTGEELENEKINL